MVAMIDTTSFATVDSWLPVTAEVATGLAKLETRKLNSSTKYLTSPLAISVRPADKVETSAVVIWND